jgi:glycosyltransferase involved in cell wall biosynthesis
LAVVQTPCDQGKILCVGRLSQEKGHFVLLESLALLHRRECPFACNLVGDGPLRPAVENRLRDLGIWDCVTLTGALSAHEVLELYPDTDVVVLSSFSEGIPVVLMEAMAFGRPVVATRVGGIPELVQHGHTGLLVPPGDPVELADAIQWVLENPHHSRRLGDQGWEFVRQEFSLDTCANELIRLFEQATTSQQGKK